MHNQIQRISVRINCVGDLNDTAIPKSEGGQKVSL